MATVITDVFLTVLKIDGLSRYQQGIRQAAGAWGEMEGKMGRLERLQRGATVGAGTFGTVLGAALNQAAKFEQTEIGFETLLGSADAAKKKLEELKQFAKESPFNFQETARLAQRALAAGIAPDELLTTMTAIGNAVSAASGGMDEFERAVRAIGQIKTNQILSKEEVNQLTEIGIPAARIFQKELGLTADQMRNVGNEGITAERAIAAFVRGSNREFGGAMERQSKTLQGRISTMEDETQEIGRNLARTWVPALAKAAEHVNTIVSGFNKLDQKTQGTASTVALGGFTALAGTALVAAAIRNVKTIMGLFGKGGAAAGASAAGAGQAAAGAAATTGIVAGIRTAFPKLLQNALKWGPMAGKLGVGIGLPLAFLSAAMGTDTKLGKGVSLASGAFTGFSIGRFLGPWGALAGTAAGLGIAAWQGGMFGGGGKPNQQQQEEKKLPNVLNRLVDALTQNTDALKEYRDLRAGVGSDEVIDVMGEARVLQLLAGKMAR